MLRSVKDLEKCTIGATDGLLGKAQDFYFDDESWVVRYLEWSIPVNGCRIARSSFSPFDC